MSTPNPDAPEPFGRPSESALNKALNKAIETFRLKLLDLTLRNPLLNYGLNAARRTHLRVVDELPDILFRRLTETGAMKRLYLQALPSLPEKVQRKDDGEEWTIEDWARKHGVNPSYELPKPSNVPHVAHMDDRIQTLLVPKTLDATAQKLRLQQLTAEQEVGFGTLHASFGYLEWYEDESSEKALYAPLVLLPVRIDRELKNGTYRYFTEAGDGQDPLTNICLREKLFKLFAIRLPDLNEDETPESYWKRIALVIRGQRRWRVIRSVTLGHLAFARLAMYEDLDADRWDVSPQFQELVSSLLAGTELSANAGARNTIHADVYDVDDEAVAKKVPFVITDLDSSQFSAVADAVDEKSFALQGPPGTGKSQTITAMIAAALARGKTVLFIAEKMAALDVVAKRLTDVGLAPFLLELHSTKTNKRRMLDAFETRLKLRRNRAGRLHDSLDVTRSKLEAERETLKRYVEALKERVALSNLSLHEVFWHEQQVRRKLDDTRLDVAKLPLVPEIANVTPVAYSHWAHAFREYGERRTRVMGVCMAGEQHPLARVRKPGASQFDIPVLDTALARLLSEINQVLSVARAATQAIGDTVQPFPTEMATLAEKLRAVPTPTESVDGRILGPITEGKYTVAQLKTARDALNTIEVAASDVRTGFNKLREVIDRTAAISTLVMQIQELHTMLGIVVTGASADVVDQKLAAERESLAEVLEALKLLQVLEGRLGIPNWSTRAPGLDAVLDLVELLRSTPSATLAHRHSGLRARDARESLTERERESEAIRQSLLALRSAFDVPEGVTAERLRQHATDLEQVRGLAYLLTPRGRALRVFTRRLNRGKLAPKAGMAKACREMAATLERVRQFESDLTSDGTVGSFAKGLATPFSHLRAAAIFVATVKERFPELDGVRAPLQRLCLSMSADELEAALAFTEPRSQTLRMLRKEHRWTDTADDFEEAIKVRMTQIAQVRAAVSGMRAEGAKGEATLGQWIAAAHGAANIQTQQNRLSPWEQWLSLSSPASVEARKAVDRVSATLTYIESVMALGLPQPIAHLLLGAHPSKQCQRVHGAARALELELQRLQQATLQARDNIGFEAGDGNSSLERLSGQVQLALNLSPEAKADWMAHLKEADAIDQAGLSELRTAIDEFNLTADQVEAGFRAAYLRSLVKHVESRVGRDTLKPGTTLSHARARLAKLDREYVGQSAQCLAEALLDRPLPEGNSVGPVKTYSELGLIRHEIGKQRANISIRSLLARAAKASQALKPCFLMSPASVSHFLPTISEFFDLLVIDEASQMRPEEALVAISRAKRAVIVGDPKQLPPSSFFSGHSGEASFVDDEAHSEDEQLTTDDESILDRALAALPYRDLQWHYRSRHQSLIAFSNREFYRDRLTVFPSPVDKSEDLGVSSVHVPDGCYQASRNHQEARRVLEVVSKLARARPDRSVGVVAMNLDQAELLNQEWDRLCAEHDDLEEYRRKWDGTLEGFFIKNLENVQGDERDAIVISTVYGPESPGAPVSQRFGPINTSQGARRLNVLFTRAKERVVVVTSMHPEDIQGDESAPEGRRILKRYLEYARHGRLDQGTPKGGGFESPFEEEVAKVLEDHGFKYETQVGVAGYRIDIAVRSPLSPDYFMVGIECDGASYHSARCARDRDRLREEVLSRLGWKLYRIWSTDWFHSRQSEIKRLVNHLRALTDTQKML